MLDHDVVFIIDAPQTLSESGDGSWVQIAKTGKFKDPRYGTFSITVADYDRWTKNFDACIGRGEAGLAIDVDHGPEKKGETEAAGWITKLERRKSGDVVELWAFAEWNTLGRELVGDKRYLYLSPSYAHDYVDETGAKHGTALRGVGLTNRPFLSMATVTLSAVGFAEELPADPAPEPQPDSPRRMPLLDDIKQRLGDKLSLSADADDAAVMKALEGYTAPPAPTNRSLADAAKEEGMIVLSVTDHAQLVSNASAGATAAAELTEQKFENAFDRALNDAEGPRVLPAMKDGLKVLYDIAVKSGDGSPVIKHIDELPSLGENVTAKGHTGSGGGGGGAPKDPALAEYEVDDDRMALHERAVAISAEKNIDYVEAVMLANAEVS